MKMLRQGIENLYSDLRDLSSIDLQKYYWLGGSKDYISSYIEMVNTILYDDSLDGFIEIAPIQIGLSEKCILEFKKLRQLLIEYKPNDHYADKEILEDPEWHKVVDQAKIVLESWNKENGLEYYTPPLL